ncbi:MAG: DUF2156 domain-containing protein [Oscillospiraceae bacterium]|nr:DUF2156 domain-containing protein [Oscillospiraceae bacterium]MBQ9148218.1 DUF2156 domain-containing protein [Oscillospiraceae bacterium]
MIEFKRLDLSNKAHYDSYLMHCGERGCEYTFTNLFLWGRQKAAFVAGCMVFQSQFDRRCVYPFPIGDGDLGAALDAVIHDARARGIPCCLTSMSEADCRFLEVRYPGQFHFHANRDGHDYVYDIHALADLKGRKYQKKRNHLNRFRETHPDCVFVPIDSTNEAAVREMLEAWYTVKKALEPSMNFHLEEVAIQRALQFREALGMESLVLMEDGKAVAFTLGSSINEEIFDIHFEKAIDEGAYVAINQAFAQYLRDKYPTLKYLDREDDMGLEGLRKAKLSYNPDHMVEKFWARLWEEEDEHCLCQ